MTWSGIIHVKKLNGSIIAVARLWKKRLREWFYRWNSNDAKKEERADSKAFKENCNWKRSNTCKESVNIHKGTDNSMDGF